MKNEKVTKHETGNTKKELGQHWLHDKQILKAIVQSANAGEGDTVLEIGPGLGTLTEKIIESKANVLALEFDQDLVPNLKKKFANCKNFAISVGDIRKFNFNDLKANYKIIANIPYYLTSNLIRIISDSSNQPSIAVLLVQKEVAERICAGPGQMSVLSVIAQLYFECSLGLEVPAKYFTPPPKVDSQVVVLKRRIKKPFDIDEKEFFRLVKAGFSEKRKTLRNSLSGGLAISKLESEKLLQKSGLNPGLRAQNLSLSQWYELYKNKP